ncbi:hypothetical protein JCGZ_02884 [Jatropha curcas]|uniref:Aminotransferase-like plant mobile domain-containing protein n=1 Tax=Jatropha curcas TaxID=180498 RepID=A0A067JR71_JATCU|nr:hypothetical protein JCGZ_02884 [Jatropha curcas]
MASSDFSDDDFLESVEVSVEEANLTLDADTHASVTGIFAQDPFVKVDVGETSMSEIPLETWAYEYFPFTHPELVNADLGLGLVPLAWRWYRPNLHTVQHKKSLKDLRAFFDTCSLAQVEMRAMMTRLQSWIQIDPQFQRSDDLSQRRVVLSHPVLRRYYLGERVNVQIRGCRSIPYSPPEDMRAGKHMMLTDVHTEGVPHLSEIGTFSATRYPFFSGFGSLD